MFILGRFVQPCLIFASKDGAYPSEASSMGATTFSVMPLSIMSFIVTLSTTILGISIECYDAGRRCAKCHFLFVVMLSAVMLSIVIHVVMLSVIMLIVVMLAVVLLIVVILNAIAPLSCAPL